MTSPAKTLALTLSALAIGVVIGQLASSAVTPRTHAPTAPTEDIARLEARVDALARQPRPTARVLPAPMPADAVDGDDDETIPTPEPSRAEVANEIAELLQLEPRDPSWSATEEATMRAALTTGPLADAQVAELECRTSACRLVLDFSNRDKLHTVMAQLPHHEAFEAGGFVHYTGTEDAPRTEIFIARRDHTLPYPL